jgi:hypothetical protein
MSLLAKFYAVIFFGFDKDVYISNSAVCGWMDFSEYMQIGRVFDVLALQRSPPWLLFRSR